MFGRSAVSGKTRFKPPEPRPPELPTWSIALPAFGVGGVQSFDLNQTLPAEIERGGVFGVHASGAPLPAGMTLSPLGVLSLGSATQGVDGIIFFYEFG